MNIKITGKELQATEAIKDYIERKLERLVKYFGEEFDVLATIKTEGKEQVAELHVSSVKPANGNKNNLNTYLAYDILSFENNDELRIEYNVKRHVPVVDFIKSTSIKYINDKYSVK